MILKPSIVAAEGRLLPDVMNLGGAGKLSRAAILQLCGSEYRLENSDEPARYCRFADPSQYRDGRDYRDKSCADSFTGPYHPLYYIMQPGEGVGFAAGEQDDPDWVQVWCRSEFLEAGRSESEVEKRSMIPHR